MTRNASRAVVLTLLLAGVMSTNAQRDYSHQSLDLLRFLATKPWAGAGHNHWDRGPRFDADLADRFTKDRWLKPKVSEQDDSSVEDDFNMDTSMGDQDITAEVPKSWGVASKRSAVATVLNGRRRRQPAPAPALGKAVTPYVGVGVLNDVGSYFGFLRDNLKGLASLSPQERASYYPDSPTVIQAPMSGGGGGGSGVRRLHALRPLRPTGNIRTYNRRSFVEPEVQYPGANHHDPGLLWTGLGR